MGKGRGSLRWFGLALLALTVVYDCWGEGEVDFDFGAAGGEALPEDGGADFAGSLADAHATKVTGISMGDGIGLKADSVIGDGEQEVVGLAVESKDDVSGAGVLQDVGDGLLGDHAELVHGERRQGREIFAGIETNGGGSGWLAGDEGLERRSQIAHGLGCISEIGNNVAHLDLNAGDQLAGGSHEIGHFFLCRAGGCGIEMKREAHELLLQGVMELAGDALSFLQRCLMSDALAEAEGLLGHLSAEAGDPDDAEQCEKSESCKGCEESASRPPRRCAE